MTSDSRDYFRDERALRFTGWGGTPVTWALIFAYSTLWFVYTGAEYRVGAVVARFFRDVLALSGADVAERFAVWQPATYFFLHQPGAVMSLIMTLAFLFFLGRELERSMGRWPYLRLYLLGGVVTGVLAVPWTYLFGVQEVPLVSSAGAVYAMTVALALRHPNLTTMFGLPMWGMTLFLLVLHTAMALTMPFGEIYSFFALAGAGFAWVHHRGADRWSAFWERRSERRRRRLEARREESAEADRRRLDGLLAKIQAEGIGALSPGEKDFLQEASKRFR